MIDRAGAADRQTQLEFSLQSGRRKRSSSESRMSSSQASSTGKRKKILRTRVKVWGRYNLRPEEVFNVDKAEQLIHRAVDSKNSLQTALKMYNEGLRIGEKGVLAALHAEFISYISITAFISLRETPTLLALCNKAGDKYVVTVLQFKDVAALEIVCNIIDRQRGLVSSGRVGGAPSSLPASSLSRSEVTVQQQQQPKPAPTVIVTLAKDDEPPKKTVTVTTASAAAAAASGATSTVSSTKEVTTTTTTNVTRVEDVSVVVDSNNGAKVELFEKRPFGADITQPPASAEVTAVVHSPPAPSTSKVIVVDDEDDDNHFRTSIVFGEDVRDSANPAKVTVVTESTGRQQRMEALLLQRANGHAVSDVSSKRASAGGGPIETVILNYDEVDTEGTHAVFDTPDGPPIQLNESADNVRWRRPQSLEVTASHSSNAGSAKQVGASRYVVTSFSSGRSDSLIDGQSVQLRGSLPSSADQAYRTSTVIYRDSPDSPTERPRVTYVSGGQQQVRTTYVAPPSPQAQQQMQLVRLVPVGSARRRVVQTHPQFYTIQPVAGVRENGVHLVAK